MVSRPFLSDIVDFNSSVPTTCIYQIFVFGVRPHCCDFWRMAIWFQWREAQLGDALSSLLVVYVNLLVVSCGEKVLSIPRKLAATQVGVHLSRVHAFAIGHIPMLNKTFTRDREQLSWSFLHYVLVTVSHNEVCGAESKTLYGVGQGIFLTQILVLAIQLASGCSVNANSSIAVS